MRTQTIAIILVILLTLMISGATSVQGIALDTATPDTQQCSHLIGSGTRIRVVIVPSGFDGANPSDVSKFEALTNEIANAFAATEPYASNLDHIIISRADDYRGKDVDDSNIWYNPTLIQAADVCDWNQIITIAHNSGWAGGSPGYFSVVGSGTPPTCDPATCTGVGCPWTPSCSWDERIAYTALHETGHTFAGLRHLCYPYSAESQKLESYERVSGSYAEAEDPINCGVQFGGDQNSPCQEWDYDIFTNWVLFGDPNFGCYAGCDDNPAWYRPWQTTTTIMCIDDYLINGFTPVDRKMLADRLTPKTIYVPQDYATISEAMVPAFAGDTIIVSGGVYTENITIKNDVALIGEGANITIIDGGGVGNVINISRKAWVQGFTIRNSGSGWWDSGIWMGAGDARITQNILTGNSKGITSLCSTPCDATAKITNNLIVNNLSDGIVTSNTAPQILNNTIANNGFTGIALNDPNIVIKNNIITENSNAGISGNNQAIQLNNNLVWGNTINYYNIIPGSSDISRNPLFISPATNNFHLGPGSPGNDSGDNFVCPEIDLDGIARPQGSNCDIGTFEFEPLVIDKSTNTASVIPGQVITFTIQVTNNLTRTITNGVISDILPTDLNFTGLIILEPPFSGTVGSAPPTLITDLVIGAGQQITVTLPVSVAYGLAGGVTITNTAGVSNTEVSIPNLDNSSISILNVPPSAVDDRGIGFNTDEDTAFTTSNVLLNDMDINGDLISVQNIITATLKGKVSDNGDGSFNYDPDGQFEHLAPSEQTTDGFEYMIIDESGAAATATVTINISGVNDAPAAANDSGVGFETDEDTVFTTWSVLTNDIDPDGAMLRVTSIDTTNTKGLITTNGDGTFSYEPDQQFENLSAGEETTDIFTYTISDGYGGISTATVTIKIIGATDISKIYFPLISR